MRNPLRLILATAALLAAPLVGAQERPNIVFFMADDLGFGDVGCYNPDSGVATPNIDRLAREGTRFINAHTPAAVCTPTRYSVLTGRFPWRDHPITAGQGITEPLIAKGQPTVASFLQKHGYRTAMIGKWHLGIEFGGGYKLIKDGQAEPDPRFDLPIVDGPLQHGFDYFFGVNGNFTKAQHLDFFIENDRPLDPATIRPKNEKNRKAESVDGFVAAGFKPEDLTRVPPWARPRLR